MKLQRFYNAIANSAFIAQVMNVVFQSLRKGVVNFIIIFSEINRYFAKIRYNIMNTWL